MKIDHALIVGYGAPAQKEDVSPYLKRLSETNRIPESRMMEVAKHYAMIGGSSPYREEVETFARELQNRLSGGGISLPVFVGMKNWHPFLEDVISCIRGKQYTAGLGIVIAPHRSFTSFDAYVQCVNRICKGAGEGEFPEYRFLEGWHCHPLFVQAHADEIRKAEASLGIGTGPKIPLIFSAHSIPLAMPGCAQYEREVRESAESIAEACGQPRWQIAWQSRSGNPDQPWLGPDAQSAIRQFKEEGARSVIVVPLGFVCDNTEILYDLDIEARSTAEREGLRYARAATVIRHPAFLDMFTGLVRTALCRT